MFDHTKKWYVLNPESVLGKETHKLFWDLKKQRDHLISARQIDLMTINKKKEKKERSYRIVDFTVPADHKVKFKELEKKYKNINLAKNW